MTTGGTAVRGALPGMLAAAVSGLLFALVYWASVRTVVGREFGDAALRGAMETRGAFSDTVDLVLDVVSVASLAGATTVVATIALVRLARVRGLVALGVLFASNGSAWLLKHHLLERPDLGLDEFTPATLNSLPSGHSTAVFSAVAAVLIVLPSRARFPVGVAGGVLALVTALATMAAGWHRAADSVAAFLLVGAWACLGVALIALLHGEPEAPPPQSRWLEPLGLGTAVLGLALALLLDALPGLREALLGELLALSAGACLVAAADALVLLLVLRVASSRRVLEPA